MQLNLALAAGLLAAICSPAQAGTCVLLPVLSGTLAISTPGYTVLGSQELGGLPATISITTLGGATVTVSAPVLYDWPAGYVPTGDVLEVSYFGVGLLAGAVHGYTTQDTSFSAPTLIAPVVLTINNRITTGTAFESTTGKNPYRTRTTITCS